MSLHHSYLTIIGILLILLGLAMSDTPPQGGDIPSFDWHKEMCPLPRSAKQ